MNSDKQNIRRSIVFGLGLSGMLGATNSFAQDAFPNKTIRVVVPFPAGANVDVVARIFTDKLSKEINQAVVVENKHKQHFGAFVVFHVVDNLHRPRILSLNEQRDCPRKSDRPLRTLRRFQQHRLQYTIPDVPFST